MADIRWHYDYFDLVGVGGRIIRPPLVSLAIGTAGGHRPEVTLGLIDSGAEFTLADWGLADDLSLDPTTRSCGSPWADSHGVHLAQVELTLLESPTSYPDA